MSPARVLPDMASATSILGGTLPAATEEACTDPRTQSCLVGKCLIRPHRTRKSTPLHVLAFVYRRIRNNISLLMQVEPEPEGGASESTACVLCSRDARQRHSEKWGYLERNRNLPERQMPGKMTKVCTWRFRRAQDLRQGSSLVRGGRSAEHPSATGTVRLGPTSMQSGHRCSTSAERHNSWRSSPLQGRVSFRVGGLKRARRRARSGQCRLRHHILADAGCWRRATLLRSPEDAQKRFILSHTLPAVQMHNEELELLRSARRFASGQEASE